MYGFADGLFRTEDYDRLIEALKKAEAEGKGDEGK